MLKQKKQTIGFYVLLAASFLVVLKIFWPFWELLAFSVILDILFYPLYKKINDHLDMPNLTAGFVVFIIALIVAGPVLLIGQQVFYELAIFSKSINLDALTWQSGNFIANLPVPLQQLAVNFNVDLHSWLSQLTGQAFNSLSGLLSSLGWFAGSLIVVAFSTFFMLRDGGKIKDVLKDVLPLSASNENILYNKLTLAINGVVKGQFLVVLAISTAAFLGFVIFGLPNALLWACAMFVAAFVPTFGTSLVWAPAVIYLYGTGHAGAAFGMILWASASVALIDNVLAAKLISSRVRLHPILTIFAILGGIVSFGFFGVLLGPILMAIFVALVEIYRTDIK
ncbi:MAG: AI-2E family transporter [Candidatus Doudnabacteria bacterium]|nr:AI-2E family transporter [Candidatus Doudnabacteria bacterium]